LLWGEECCNFIDLIPESSRWDNPFYLTYGRHNAGYFNAVSAQIVYVDYILEEHNSYEDIVYSNLGTLNAYFENSEGDFSLITGMTVGSSSIQNEEILIDEI